jgi:hypothetical protein
MKPAESAAPMGPARQGETTLRMAIGQFESHANPDWLLCCIENKSHFSPEQLAFLQAMEEPLKRSSDHGQFLEHLYSMCGKEVTDFLDKVSDSQLSRVNEQTFQESIFKLEAIKVAEDLGKLAMRMADGQVSSPEEAEQAIAEITNRFGSLKSIAREPRFKLLSYDDLGALKGESYLIDKILVPSQLNEIFGPPGNGKTFLALNMALSIASGQPFLGLPVKRGHVVYIYSEGQGGSKNRVDAWLKYHGLEPEVIKARWHLIDKAVHLLEATEEQDLCRSIKDSGVSPDLIVIDTLARAFCGGNPDLTADMSRFVTSCENIQRAFDSAVLLVHHSIKSNSKVDSGSHMLRGAASSVFHLEIMGTGKAGAKELKLSCQKTKDADNADRIFDLLLEPVLLEPDKNGKEQTSCVITLGSSTPEPPKTMVYLQALVTALEDQDQPGLTSTAWHKACGCSKSTFHNHRKQLLEDGMVVHNGKLYSPTEKGRAALSGD